MREAGISIPGIKSPPPDGVLVESGHQPNFFPHANFFKKIFLQARLIQCAGERDLPAVGIFGLADQNISTARLLSSNRVPAWNRGGYLKVGFTISPGDKERIFRSVATPDRDAWEREWDRIRDHYFQQGRACRSKGREFHQHFREVEDIYARSYERASNFADLNGFFIASLCSEIFKLPVLFFRYSDVQGEGLFAPVLYSILRNRSDYTRGYNEAAAESGGFIPPVSEDHLPVWLHCQCGGKVPLSMGGDETVSGTCPVCHKPHALPGISLSSANLEKALPTLGLNAISRHLVFFEGLGTTVFLSGAGGGVRYGRIATKLAARLGMHNPVSIAVRSHDYYLGSTHITGLRESAKLFRLLPREMASPGIRDSVAEWHERSRKAILGLSPGAPGMVLRKKMEGDYHNGTTRVRMLKALFSQKPSALDIIIMQGLLQVREGWCSASRMADLNLEGGIVYADIIYHAGDTCSGEFSADEVEQLYEQIPRLGVTYGT